MVKEVLRKVIQNNSVKQLEYKNEGIYEKNGISNKKLYEMSQIELRNKVREVDKNDWINEIEKFKTLEMYRKYKTEIKYEGIYDNRLSTIWLFRARSNSLKVNQRAYFLKECDRVCGLCKKEEESLEHFMLKCMNLELKRKKEVIEKFKGLNEEDTLGHLLFEMSGEDLELVKEMINKMWVAREKSIELMG